MGDIKDEEDEKLVYTPEEARRILRVSRGTIYTLLARKLIPFIKVGRRYLIPKRRFHIWLDELPLPPSSASGDK